MTPVQLPLTSPLHPLCATGSQPRHYAHSLTARAPARLVRALELPPVFFCDNLSRSLLFNHKGGYGNIESACCIHEQKIDVSHMPQPMPQATHGVLLLVVHPTLSRLFLPSLTPSSTPSLFPRSSLPAILRNSLVRFAHHSSSSSSSSSSSPSPSSSSSSSLLSSRMLQHLSHRYNSHHPPPPPPLPPRNTPITRYKSLQKQPSATVPPASTTPSPSRPHPARSSPPAHSPPLATCASYVTVQPHTPNV